MHQPTPPSQAQDPLAEQKSPSSAFLADGISQHRSVSLLNIQFSGSGSEYFRIWIVNLLLMLVTLGLYYPWAKVRRQKYFYGNTVVAGHPLAYHAEPRKMLRGFLLVIALMFAYAVASKTSQLAGGIAGLILAGIWPAIMRSSLQFRMANTSWRGLRFSFNGSLKDAYLIFLVPLAALLGIGLMALMLGAFMGSLGRVAMLILAMLGAYSMAPYVWWRLKRYQHSHYRLGEQQTSFKATFGDVTGVFFRAGLVGIAALLVALIVMALLSVASFHGMAKPVQPESAARQGLQILSFLSSAAIPLVMLFLMMRSLVGAFFVSRMQNLIWSKTGNRQMRFKSHLRLLPLAKLSALNLILMVLTIGLYWPFAQIAMTRLKLQSIQIHSRLNPDQLVGNGMSKQNNAAGDLAADFLGFDVGL